MEGKNDIVLIHFDSTHLSLIQDRQLIVIHPSIHTAAAAFLLV